jgi:hypothetical protein
MLPAYSRRRIGTPRVEEAFVILSLFGPVFNSIGVTIRRCGRVRLPLGPMSHGCIQRFVRRLLP